MSSDTIAAVRRILATNHKKSISDPSLTPAGVILLLYLKDGDYCVLLNKRSDSVEDHKGEISFPGGRKDESDRTVRDTALRETFEEMGIKPGDIELLGELDDEPTISKYVITPFVGTIPYPYEFKPSPREVAEVLEIPVFALRDKRNHREEVRLADGQLERTRSYAYRGHLVFGATAKLLTSFLALVDGATVEEISWQR